jgi:hypothetical protein
VLDARIESFASRERFAHAVLGLLSFTERTRALALAPRATPGRAPDGPVTDFLLGLISLGYSLRATIGCAPGTGASSPLPPTPPLRSDRMLR